MRKGFKLFAAGHTMNTVANALASLGRQQDAVAMLEKALEFDRLVLPQNHPDIGA
jgi:hypothetical protein